MFSAIQSLDLSILNTFQLWHNPYLNSLMVNASLIGTGGAIWIIVSLVLLFSKKYRWYGLASLVALIIVGAVGNLGLKNIFARPRPFDVLPPSTPMLISRPSDYSFPSGHAMTSFATVPILFATSKLWGIVGLVLAFLIAISRVYLYVHFPTDVLMGSIFGLCCGIISLKILKKCGKLF